ncbi:YiiX family permuted papain-like enzyme [Pedobacter jamesrossensis]|uniref:YiiX family permuted papain-like enzyme n=1 Tax=Pedobacter jamesrossensis TaxID=1908238 RepID=A0ABV8NL74_9SPHI
MIRIILITFIIFVLNLATPKVFYHLSNQASFLVENIEIKDGDIIFQTSTSTQSKAIQVATHSKYSHCGIIFKINNQYFVFEAVEPVKFTPLKDWINKGLDKHYVIKRLKNANKVLSTSIIEKMKLATNQFKGKHYDIYFDWSDEKIYCSELIWKIYKGTTGIEIGNLEKLKNFDLNNIAVKKKMAERYGNNLPLNQKVISPVSIFNSPLLKTISSN